MRMREILQLFLPMLLFSGCASGSAGAETVTVLAASSLTEPLQGHEADLAPLVVRYSFGGSQTLVTQVTQGTPADVIATADEASMAKLVSGGFVEQPSVFVTNRIVIAVANGNPKKVTGLADLARPDVSVVLADPSVPVGRYARQALDAAHVQVTPKSLELDARVTLGRVENGSADAAIVYATDVRSSQATTAVLFPEADAVAVRYPIAIIKTTKHHSAATTYVTSMRSGRLHDLLLAAGFTS
jgi:molybdate transport system substrate-binding protein